MSPLDTSGSWLFALALVAIGVATSVVVLTRYPPRVDSHLTSRVNPTGEAPGGSAQWYETVVFPSNDPTGGRYLDDPARAGWETPTESGASPGSRAAEGDSTLEDVSDSSPSSARADLTRLVTVSAATVEPARNALEAGETERAVDRAFRAVRDELTQRADLDAHRAPRDFYDACCVAFEADDLDAVESLVDLHERVTAGDTVSPGVVEAVLDRLTGREGRLDRYEWWDGRQ